MLPQLIRKSIRLDEHLKDGLLLTPDPAFRGSKVSKWLKVNGYLLNGVYPIYTVEWRSKFYMVPANPQDYIPVLKEVMKIVLGIREFQKKFPEFNEDSIH
jgi:hypothetical protein